VAALARRNITDVLAARTDGNADHATPGWTDLSKLKRDEIGMNRHRALDYCLSMIFPENRFTLFRIML